MTKEQARTYYKQNREQVLRRTKAYYRKNRKRVLQRNRNLWFSKSKKERKIISRKRQVKCLYGLTFVQHMLLLKQQNFVCPISGQPVDMFSHIDHDHSCCPGEKSCGKCIRGILAGKINSALGFFKNPKWLFRAHLYLTRKSA